MYRKYAIGSMIGALTLLLISGAAAQQVQPEAPLGTAFTYQGRLNDAGSPANGSYDLLFILYDASLGGSQVGSMVTQNDLDVVDGFFTVLLDFEAGAFTGQAHWLEISVRPGDSTGSYTSLSPRQALTAAPYALYSRAAPWSGLSGIPAGFADGVDNDTTTFWSLTGNSGTTPGTNYLGTSDNTALVLRVNGGRALRIEPSSEAPNLIGGWWENYVTAGVRGATISGGGSGEYGENRVTDIFGTVSGGMFNQAGDSAGDTGDRASATVGGGYKNTAGGMESTVSGGGVNQAFGDGATIGGGIFNFANGLLATVAGGGSPMSNDGNRATDSWATVGGGSNNQAGDGANNGSDQQYATVAGGVGNLASAHSSTVSGGWNNTASGQSAVVAGGYGNTASDFNAAVGGGDGNLSGGSASTISGGWNNNANADYAAVGGGVGNVVGVGGESGTIGGGWRNLVDGNTATVPGGAENEATGAYSFAAGAQGHATHAGSFVWSSGENTYSYADRTFTVRAHGGARFYTASGTATGVSLAAGGGSWSSLSDRSAKENFSLVDPQVILAQLAQLPIASWNYIAQDDAIRHLGPTAQDFSALFSLGEDNTHITTVDADGVALAAIQGLYTHTQEQAARITELAAENRELKAQLSDFDARLAVVERTTGAPAPPATGSFLPLAGLAALGFGGACAWCRKAGER